MHLMKHPRKSQEHFLIFSYVLVTEPKILNISTELIANSAPNIEINKFYFFIFSNF